MPVATIDIGTNTVLLLVAHRDERGQLVALQEEAEITRLGQGVDKTKKLAPDAVERTEKALTRYASIIREHRCTAVDVVGTSAMRDAGGSEVIRELVQREMGVPARVISGDEEARLTFRGALSGLPVPKGPLAVFDIGGGSTEIVLGEHGAKDAIQFATSVNIGSVRLTERAMPSDPPTAAELAAAGEAANKAFADVPALVTEHAPVGIAGTMTTLAAIGMKMKDYDGARVHGSMLTLARLREIVDQLARLPLAERRNVTGLEPKRADVIVAGGLVAIAVLEKLGKTEARVSDRGVRWGLAEVLAEREEHREPGSA